MHNLKTLIKNLLPKRILSILRFLKVFKEDTVTKKVFESSKPLANYLSITELRELQMQYSYNSDYGYSLDEIDKRGKEKAKALIRLIPDKTTYKYLELGCWDGMVCYHLKKNNKLACGVDIREIGFDKRAIESGVDLRVMDASKLIFEDNSFDVTFSFDSFEHFKDPTTVLKELYRITKPGGHIYLEFGPLFMSPFGLHLYRQIHVPYCQFLFSEETLAEYLQEKNLGQIDFTFCNGWELIHFRQLFNSYSKKLKKVKYLEGFNYMHLDLIRKYPSTFKSKTDHFENLICKSIIVLFEKINLEK